MLLAVLLLSASLVALCFGATAIGPRRAIEALAGSSVRDGEAIRDHLVIFDIRLPRLLLGIAVGSALAVAGAIMQGLFRNPLADPGLIGVSSGAGLASAAALVLGDKLAAKFGLSLPFAVLPLAAFAGALISTVLLYAIASRGGRTSMAIMLLAGIAFAALANAGTGWLAFLSDDRQLRDLTFWSMGSLGGATWTKVEIVVPVVAAALIATPILADALNALALGEAEAFSLGINVERIKAICILVVSVSVGAAVACSGLIAFVGIIVPHALRLVVGPSYRVLLPASALLGAVFLVAVDIAARTLVAPSELPIGIVTATVGGPFFLWLLLRRRRDFGL